MVTHGSLTPMKELDVCLIVCGAPLTRRAPDLISTLMTCGWPSRVIGTPAAKSWLDGAAIEKVIGECPRFEFRSSVEPKLTGRPSAVIVCPATFNTINKAAIGAADNYALAVMCEAMATGVPMVSARLWGHPAWPRSLKTLREAGAVLMNPRTGGLELSPMPSGLGEEVTANFDPQWIIAQLDQLVS